jgi:hypothetical protein
MTTRETLMTKREDENALALIWAQGVMSDLDLLQKVDCEPGLNRNLALANLLYQIANVPDGMLELTEPVKALAKDFSDRAIVDLS